MPDTQLSQLLDRAVHEAPPMHLDGAAMLGAGRGRVRRRRAVGVGGALGAVALVGALWFGPGGAGTPTGVQEIHPATTVWEPGETVEGTLFAGLQTVDEDQVGHDYAAQLSRPGGEGPVTLTLSDEGRVVEQVASTSPVPGLEVFAGDRMTVALWVEPDGVRSSVPLVGPHDPGGPANVQHAEVGGEELAYAVWSADVVPLPEEVVDVYLVGRGGAVRALSGTPVGWVGTRVAGHSVDGFADEERGVLGLVVEDQEPVLTQVGDGSAQVFSSAEVSAEDVETSVALLPVGAEVQGVVDGDGEIVGSSGSTVTPVLGRPLVVVVREDASSGPPSDLAFTLGGESWTLRSYAQDLREIDLADGTSLEVAPDGADGVVLRQPGTDEPVATFGGAAGVSDALTTQPVGGSLVTLAEEWDAGPTVLADARVEVTRDGAARWVARTDAAQVVRDDGRLVTLVAVNAEDDLEVAAVGLERDGQVERWEPPTAVAGVEFRRVDGVEVPYVDGEALPRIDDGASSAFRHYAGTDGQTSYVVLPDEDGGPAFVPLTPRDGVGAQAAPDLVRSVDEFVVDGVANTVLTLSGGRAADGSSTVHAVIAQNVGPEGTANTWRIAGDAASAHATLDPDIVVSIGREQGVWILYPRGSVDPTQIQAGTINGAVREVGPQDGLATLVAVLTHGAEPRLVGEVQGALDPMSTTPLPERGVDIFTWRVQLPEGVELAGRGAGLDTDRDGQADILLEPRD